MAEATKIEWCHATFNPWRGCSKVNLGCKNCYAEVNYSVKMHGIKWGTQAQGGTRVKLADAGWKEPLKWNRAAEKAGERRRVFCASLADVFEDWSGPILDHNGGLLGHCQWCGVVWRLKGHSHCARCDRVGGIKRDATMDDLRADLFRLIDATPHLDWLLLTKRPENVVRMWPHPTRDPVAFLKAFPEGYGTEEQVEAGWRPNVWVGASVSDRETAETIVPAMLPIRHLTPVMFLSAEPLIGPLGEDFIKRTICPLCEDGLVDVTGDGGLDFFGPHCGHCDGKGHFINWLIVGGESGHGARPCDVSWIRSIRDQCKAEEISVFVKQLGAIVCDSACQEANPERCGHGIGMADGIHYLSLDNGKGGNPSEWPEDLRVREFPQSHGLEQRSEG